MKIEGNNQVCYLHSNPDTNLVMQPLLCGYKVTAFQVSVEVEGVPAEQADVVEAMIQDWLDHVARKAAESVTTAGAY